MNDDACGILVRVRESPYTYSYEYRCSIAPSLDGESAHPSTPRSCESKIPRRLTFAPSSLARATFTGSAAADFGDGDCVSVTVQAAVAGQVTVASDFSGPFADSVTITGCGGGALLVRNIRCKRISHFFPLFLHARMCTRADYGDETP